MKLFSILVVKLPSWLKDLGDHILIGRTTSPVCQAKISLNEIYLELWLLWKKVILNSCFMQSNDSCSHTLQDRNTNNKLFKKVLITSLYIMLKIPTNDSYRKWIPTFINFLYFYKHELYRTVILTLDFKYLF